MDRITFQSNNSNSLLILRRSMKGLCLKCYTSGVEVIFTEVTRNKVGITETPLCDNCRE